MKKTFLILLSLIMILLLSGCCLSHEWVDASCTAPKTCSKCGETEGEPVEHQWLEATCTAPSTCAGCGETQGNKLPHKFGKEELQNPNYVDATATFVKTCEQCGEQSKVEKEITQFVDQGVFLMTPEEFSDRFTQALMDMPYLQDFDFSKHFNNTQTDLKKLMDGSQYLSFVSDDTMSYDLTMYMAKRDRNGKIDIVGEFEMRDSENHFMSNDQKNESGVLWKIHGKVKGKASATVAMLALYRAAATSQNWEEFIKGVELSPYVDPSYHVSTELNSFATQRIPRICYEITPKGKTYEFTITTK
jgi:hypothetical protein